MKDLEPIFNDSEDWIDAFYRLQAKFIENFNIWRKFSGRFNVDLVFPEKRFWISQGNFACLNLLPTLNHTEDSIYTIGRFQNKSIGTSNIEIKSSQSFKGSLPFPEKWFCIC